MYAATANGTAGAEAARDAPDDATSRPNVATNSLNIWAAPSAHVAWTRRTAVPRTWCVRPRRRRTPPRSARRGTPAHRAQRSPPCEASASVTAGLKCAPEIGPNVRIRATSTAPVASVLASSAIATLPPASRSAMMPEPTTAARSSAVPTPSAVMRRGRSTWPRGSAMPSGRRARNAGACGCRRARGRTPRAARPRFRRPRRDRGSSNAVARRRPERADSARSRRRRR